MISACRGRPITVGWVIIRWMIFSGRVDRIKIHESTPRGRRSFIVPLIPRNLDPPAICLLIEPLSHDICRRKSFRIAARGAEVDELALGRRMGLREGLADRDSQGPEVLRAEPAVVDPAGVLAAGETRPLARAGQLQRRAHLLADRPARLVVQLRPERQILDVLLAAAIGLEPDRGNRARARGPARGAG